MALELLLCSRRFARPRQFVLHSDRLLDGANLDALLTEQCGAGPWYCSGRPLTELPEFGLCDSALITDVPADPPPATAQPLRLYVLDGPNAGAAIVLTPGTHPVGRCAPLWLEDPALARVQGIVRVDERHITLHPEPGPPVRLLNTIGSVADGEIRLQRGSLIRMGGTTLKVQDPREELDAGQVSPWPQPPPRLPDKPQLQRLLTMLGAAFVPILIGALLAVLTGSIIFLLLSSLSALLAVFPVIGLIRARREYRRVAREHTHGSLRVRQRLAPALGTVLAAATIPGEAGRVAGHAKLVLGRGLWHPRSTERDAQLSGPAHPSPVFALQPTGAWQFIGQPDEPQMQVLCAILARLLPAVITHGPMLVLDPALPKLPTSLLLLPNVRLGLPPLKSEIASGRTAPNEVCRSIFVVAGSAYPVPESLVLGFGPQRVEPLTGWVEANEPNQPNAPNQPNTPHQPKARLDDPQAQLGELDRLSIAHFARLVQCWLPLKLVPRSSQEHAADSETLRCDIGDDEAGRPVELDLESDGPHLLVAGTTGSGKSEALRRIVTELVSRYSPYRLALALVDFKGGASLSVFANLPHTQLFASDLDGAGALRMLQQLEIEIHRRERLMQEADCSDLGEYQQLGGERPLLPRLLVVVDEFRVFIDQLPEAAPRIDRIATVGRALGIHLLLSTQKPTGTLSAQTRANINTVIALRVREPSESSDLIGSALASQLQRPGEAIWRSAGVGPLRFQFRLAAPAPAAGYLAERADTGFGEYRRQSLRSQPVAAAEGIELLRQRVAEIATTWQVPGQLPNPFAPQLPESWQLLPPHTPAGPQLVCGVLDRLDRGRLDALCITPADGASLLVAGLAEAGLSHLAKELLQSGVRVLCFDGTPDTEVPPSGQRLVVTGRDIYLVRQALDFLSDSPNLAGLVVVVRNLAGLVAAIPPTMWTRFEQVLATLIRRAPHSGVQVIILGDRDLSVLKAATLCTRRWYFPFGASAALTMSWPKLPPVSPLPGRGVQIADDGRIHGIQLTGLRAGPFAPAATWQGSAVGQPAGSRWWLGTTGLEPKMLVFEPHGIGFIIVPDQKLREELAQVLCARWGLQLCQTEEQLRSCAAPAMVLRTSPGPQLAGLLNSLALAGGTPLVFCAPSARLAYEFALPAMALDERDVLLIEASHPFDMQPLNWPALATAEAGPDTEYWRALKLVEGQPAEVRIPRRT